ncbi:MAG: MmcQ/YjbR family DNA-binding protein [Burkholderiales bacterium]|nr:MmcQ/YjbR family DNA-binding protein [Burkholderiales bacterium]
MTLAEIRRFALALPEASEAPHFHYSSYRVRGKIFVTVPPEQTHLHVFVADEHREPALAMHPGFLEKLLWGGKVVGLRVALARAEPAVVRQLVQQAWARKAPKSLLSARTKGP